MGIYDNPVITEQGIGQIDNSIYQQQNPTYNTGGSPTPEPTYTGGSSGTAGYGDFTKTASTAAMLAGQPWLAVGLQLVGGILSGLSRPKPKAFYTPEQRFFERTVDYYAGLGKKFKTLNSLSTAFGTGKTIPYSFSDQFDIDGMAGGED